MATSYDDIIQRYLAMQRNSPQVPAQAAYDAQPMQGVVDAPQTTGAPVTRGQYAMNAVKGLIGNRDLALAILQNSGRSPYKRGLGEIVSASMLQADQAKSQREDDAFKRQYMQAQMQAMGGRPVAVMGPDGKPVYVAESDVIGKSPVQTEKGMGALYRYRDPKTGKPIFGDASSAIGQTPFIEGQQQQVPAGYRFSKDGNLEFIPGGPADPRVGKRAAKPSEYDKKAKLLYSEMLDAEKQYQGASGADTSSAWNATLNSNPVTRYFTSEDYRKHEASGMRWAQNFLYLKSGASAPVEEVRKTFVQYLPQPGDSPAVIAQKSEARQQAMANVADASQFDPPGEGDSAGADSTTINWADLK